MSARIWLTNAVLLCTCAAFADGQGPAPDQQVRVPVGQVQAAPRDFTRVSELVPASKGLTQLEVAQETPPEGFGTRDGGDTCASATLIDELPFEDTGTTIGKANNYSPGAVADCSASTAPDAVYKFTPVSDVLIDVSLCTGTSYDTQVYIYQDTCANPPADCDDDYTGCGTDRQSKLVGVPLLSGHTYYIVVDGYGTSSGIYHIIVTPSDYLPPACPADSLHSQTPNLNPAPGQTLAYTSDVDAGQLMMLENVYGVGGLLCDLHWWGIQGVYSNGWYQCDEPNPQFNITVYPSLDFDPFLPDLANPLCSWQNLSATRTDTGERPGGWTLYYFEAQLPGCCGPLDPAQQYWIAVQGTGGPSCWFLWWISDHGLDDFSQQYVPPDLTNIPADVALCLTPGTSPGACCDHVTGQCTNVANASDCAIANGFYPGVTCAELSPACGQATGACCFTDGTPCSVITAGACATAAGEWLGPGTACEQCPCVVVCTHGNTVSASGPVGGSPGSVPANRYMPSQPKFASISQNRTWSSAKMVAFRKVVSVNSI